MFRLTIGSQRLSLWMRIIPILTLLCGGQAGAADKDYFVFLSDAVDNKPAGTVSDGLAPSDGNFSIDDNEACGVLIKSVYQIYWYFYEANSSPPIDKKYVNKDVEVYLPLPGCSDNNQGNNDQVRIKIDDVEVLPQGGAADYVVLEDGSSFIAIDQDGNPLGSGGAAIGSQLPNFLDEPLEPPYMKVISSTIAQIKSELLEGDPRGVLPGKFRFVSDYARARSANNSTGQADDDMVRFRASMNRCQSHYFESDLDRAYVDCDIGMQRLDSIISRHETMR